MRTDTISEVEPKRHSLLVDLVIRLVKEKPLGTVGGVIVLVMFLTGIFADVLAPYGMNEVHPADTLSPPSPQYMLGTDLLGRDILTRIIYGARISMIVGLAGAALGTVVAIVIGVPCGFFGGKFDLTVQRLVDAFMCWPWLFFILTIMVMVGQGLPQVIFVLGIRGGIVNSRIVRSAVIGIKENVYVEATRAIGCPPWRILTRHILPNIMAPIIIIFTLRVGQMILAEATISFLGFGIPPPMPSWGGMLSGQGRRFMLMAPWLAIWSGLALSIVVCGINMLGDGVRDILDPRLKGGAGRYGRAKLKKNRKGR
ncbi:Glutathione transport system permease protein GsiD [subsurface metagenome]